MAARKDVETNGCSFQWKISNISHCWLKKGQLIKSPTFIAEGLKSTKWSLWLFPMGHKEPSFVSLYLNREEDCNGPNNFEVSYQLAFLDKNGSFLKEKIVSKFSVWKGNHWGFHKFEKREKVFATDRELFLPADSLTVLCRIWKEEEKPFEPNYSYAHTIFTENRISFVWRIDRFSTLKHDVRNEFKDGLIDFDVVLTKEVDIEKTLVINFNSFSLGIKYFSFKTSIVDSEGKKENCGFQDYFADNLKKGVLCEKLFTKKLMENKSRYLPIDALFLDFEYVTLTETLLYEPRDPDTISLKSTKEVVESRKEEYVEKEHSFNTTMLADDLEFMYTHAILCDTQLCTTKKTFPAHKNILSARSPVFRSMFRNEMKEKNSGKVDIIDLNDDTMHRMLLYIYTDFLGDLQFGCASELYAAANKYQIQSLKTRCSTFLKDNLCPSKVCEILLLADVYYDDNLKSDVHDYILRQPKEFFCSQEWIQFMKNHIKLAADVMHRKIYQE